jgi:hypothetical protein
MEDSPVISFRYHTTAEILAILHYLAENPGCDAPAWMRRRGGPRSRLGDDGMLDEAASWMQHAAERGTDVAQTAVRATLDTAGTPFGWAYGKIQEGAADLEVAAKKLRDDSFETAGAAADELARRARQFAATMGAGIGDFGSNVASGLGKGYREFFGFPPGVAILVGLVVMGGLGYLVLSPGGQALLSGGASAISSGGGQLLAGGGRALGSLALV